MDFLVYVIFFVCVNAVLSYNKKTAPTYRS